MDTIVYIIMILVAIYLTYVLIRLLSYAVFKSYFAAKNNMTMGQTIEKGEKDEEIR